MTNLFSVFDPYSYLTGVGHAPINWAAAMLILGVFPGSFWLQKGQLPRSVTGAIMSLRTEMSAVLSTLAPPGSMLAFFTFFIFIAGSNVLGLVPYIFTSSSHLSFTMALALPLWAGGIVWSMLYQANTLLTHLVPVGTPKSLMPVMVIIETVSNLIRPGALAVRLAANMVAGHLLLSLLGGQGQGVAGMVLVGVMVSLSLLMVLECAVACIQAYVFTILSTLYLDELMSVAFNSRMSM